jgi:hypothetical protein
MNSKVIERPTINRIANVKVNHSLKINDIIKNRELLLKLSQIL